MKVLNVWTVKNLLKYNTLMVAYIIKHYYTIQPYKSSEKYTEVDIGSLKTIIYSKNQSM